MRIDIALRFKPFSHEIGTICLIPGTSWRVQAFPTLLRLFGPNQEVLEHKFVHSDFIEGFTVQQDLEKKQVRIWGRPNLDCRIDAEGVWENKKRVLTLPATPRKENKLERLSMGCHKAQEWERVRRRLDLTEILPLWFHLGQMTPKLEAVSVGTLHLLEECLNLRNEKDKLQLEEKLKCLFLLGFGPMFDARVHDPELRGLIPNADIDPTAATLLLTKGSELIRSLVCLQDTSRWQILPCPLPHFHSGRFQSEQLSLEWSNTKLKKIILHPTEGREIVLAWPKDLRSCRLRHDPKERGTSLENEKSLSLCKNQVLYLDRFER